MLRHLAIEELAGVGTAHGKNALLGQVDPGRIRVAHEVDFARSEACPGRFLRWSWRNDSGAGPEPTRFGDWEKNGRCIDF
ncbi:MAG: DUF1674 domain-containing protein [Gammaproteobacteria bacterium]|nr:DUF1674 domain-containing protein [Gammaproteobacteria bacterium]